MSDVRPFRALRYVRDPGPRIAPPYDVISESEREQLAAEPENIVHLTLPPGPQGERDYAAATQTLARWLREGVLTREPEECLYVLEERIADGRVRKGFLGLLRLADYEERVVLPHERTMAGPKRDRLLLTRAVRANLEPLLFMYEDRDGKLALLLEAATRGRALTTCSGSDGRKLALHAGPTSEGVAAVRTVLADRPLIIADGHHRYETMLAYRNECREHAADPDAPHEVVLAYMVHAFDPGSQIFAIHRVLEGEIADPAPVLKRAGFRLEPRSEASAGPLLELLEQQRERAHALVLARPGGPCLLASRPRGAELDVEVLHSELLPGLGGELSFDAQPARLLERVRRSEVSLGILMNPLDADALFHVVQGGKVLPEKSTFFSPKVPSGLVIREL